MAHFVVVVFLLPTYYKKLRVVVSYLDDFSTGSALKLLSLSMYFHVSFKTVHPTKHFVASL